MPAVSARTGPSGAHRAVEPPIPRSAAARPWSAARCRATAGPGAGWPAPCGRRRAGQTWWCGVWWCAGSGPVKRWDVARRQGTSQADRGGLTIGARASRCEMCTGGYVPRSAGRCLLGRRLGRGLASVAVEICAGVLAGLSRVRVKNVPRLRRARVRVDNNHPASSLDSLGISRPVGHTLSALQSHTNVFHRLYQSRAMFLGIAAIVDPTSLPCSRYVSSSGGDKVVLDLAPWTFSVEPSQ